MVDTYSKLVGVAHDTFSHVDLQTLQARLAAAVTGTADQVPAVYVTVLEQGEEEVTLTRITDNLWIDVDAIVAIQVTSNGKKTKYATVTLTNEQSVHISRTKEVDALLMVVAK